MEYPVYLETKDYIKKCDDIINKITQNTFIKPLHSTTAVELGSIERENVTITDTTVTNPTFSNLIPSSITNIMMDGKTFPSISHYVIYSLYINFLGVDRSVAYNLIKHPKTPITYPKMLGINPPPTPELVLTYKELVEKYKENRNAKFVTVVATSIQNALDVWASHNISKLLSLGRKSIIFQSSNKFIGLNEKGHGNNYIGKYLMHLRDAFSISRKILAWAENTKTDMMFVVKKMNEVFDNTEGIRVVFGQLYDFPYEEATVKVFRDSPKKTEQVKVIEDYITEFLSYALSVMSTEDIEKQIVEMSVYNNTKIDKKNVESAISNIIDAIQGPSTMEDSELRKIAIDILLGESAMGRSVWDVLKLNPKKYVPRVLLFQPRHDFPFHSIELPDGEFSDVEDDIEVEPVEYNPHSP
jgi:predicted NAD-dependent protein-ADP-ribosyltransferase YbiA (DUF1768 family)